MFHCFRPVFSARGSRRGSKCDPRFLFASDKALPYNKAGFLTEYAELGKMRSGAARTAGRRSALPGREVMPIVTYSELFQLCLVLIGFAGLIIQICKRK